MTIDEYLDDLYARLPRDPRAARRTLDEAADHLHASADALQDRGLDRDAAEAEAVRRFGPTAPLARDAARRSLRAMITELVGIGVLLGGLGLVAVGVSGGIVALLNAWLGPTFVGGPPDSTTVQIAGEPARNVFSVSALGRPTQVAADAVSLRVLAGVVGVVVVALVWLVRRRTGRTGHTALPPGLTAVLAAAAFAGASLVLGAASVDQWVQHGLDGVGYFLSGAVVAALGFAVTGVRATRVLLAR